MSKYVSYCPQNNKTDIYFQLLYQNFFHFKITYLSHLYSLYVGREHLSEFIDGYPEYLKFMRSKDLIIIYFSA